MGSSVQVLMLYNQRLIVAMSHLTFPYSFFRNVRQLYRQGGYQASLCALINIVRHIIYCDGQFKVGSTWDTILIVKHSFFISPF